MLADQQIGKSLSNQISEAIRSVVGDGRLGLHEPVFAGNEHVYVQECLDSTFVSSVGRFVDQFESELAEYTGANYAVAVVNGTAALHVGLKVAGVCHGDEVLVPALTFVATANAVIYCGALPHFVDSDCNDFGIACDKLRDYLLSTTDQRNNLCFNKKTGKVIRAMVPMHVFGHPCDLDKLLAISEDFNIVIVEDAAESLGSFYEGQHTGTFGKVGALSFNGNKIITTGGGGAILTNDKALARYLKHLTTTAKVPHAWEYNHNEVGYNYRMPNLNAALGCAQLERLEEYLVKKRNIFTAYSNAFLKVDGVRLQQEPSNCSSNYWLNTIVLDEQVRHERNDILRSTNEQGVMTRPVWSLMSRLDHFEDAPSMDLSTAKILEQTIINIPSGFGLAVQGHD